MISELGYKQARFLEAKANQEQKVKLKKLRFNNLKLI